MDRQGLIDYWVRALAAFVYTPAEAKRHSLRISSGTSGQGPMMALTGLTPWALSDWFVGEGRVVLCFGSRAIRLYNLLGSLEAGLDALALDSSDLTTTRLAPVADFKPTRFHGFPSFVLRVAALLPPEVRAGVRELRLVGELITEPLERALREQFPHATWRSSYAASEIGGITRASCGYLPRNHYHVLSGVEVAVDTPDESGVGELVISKQLGTLRIESYRTGDLGRLYDVACPCGETRALELFGRAGFDYLKLAGAMLRVEEFDRALAALKPLVADYRVEAQTLIEHDVPKGKVRIVLYTPTLPTEARQRELVDQVGRSVYATPTRTLSQLAADGIFTPLEAAFVTEPFAPTTKVVRMRYIS